MVEFNQRADTTHTSYSKNDVSLCNTNLFIGGNDVQERVVQNCQHFIKKFLSDTAKKNHESSNSEKMFEHALRRSIRGVGSSVEVKMAENYLNLISLLRLGSKFSVNLDTIFNLMEAELSPITNKSRDKREVKTGQLLVISAVIFSGMHKTSQEFDVGVFMDKLIKLGQEQNCYVSKLIAFKVLKHLISTTSEEIFKNTILPILADDIKSQNTCVLTYFLLLKGEETFPLVCTHKAMKQILGHKNVLNKNTITMISNDLQSKNGQKLLPVICSDLCKVLLQPEKSECLAIFLELLNATINSDNPSVDSVTSAFVIVSELAANIYDVSQILTFLTQTFTSCLVYPPRNKTCIEKRDVCLKSVATMLEKHKEELKSTICLSIIEKVLFFPGDFSFEKTLSGKTFIRQIISLMNKKGVKKLALMLRDVITGSSVKEEIKDGETVQRPWHNKEKMFSVHFLNRLLRHKSVYENQSFKIEQLKFLTDIGFIVNPSLTEAAVSCELAQAVREGLYSAVTHRVPSLSHFQHMFFTIIGHIDSHIKQGSKLRVKFTDDMKVTWSQMMTSIGELENNKNCNDDQDKAVVFTPIFLQLALLLFKETNFAMDCLKELEEVYSRTVNNADYQQWSGDVVELLLSLLSRSSQLHRNLIKCIFSHLCAHLTSENIIAILRVLDPRMDSNPLVSKAEANDSSDSEDESESDSGAETESEGDETDDEDETTTDKLRQALQSALISAGVGSDNESIDVDDMDEEEGMKVDAALSKAFASVKSVKGNKDKKQIAAEKALTDFRLRVIDLLEVWLNTESPKLYDLLDVMLTVLHLYGVCIMDRKQAPLVSRIRAFLKKLTSLRKVADAEAVTDEKLAEILTVIIQQKDISSTVFIELAKTVNDCTIFVLRFSKRFSASEETESSCVLNVIMEAMDRFFTQRNCPLQKGFFSNILNMDLYCNWYLAERISNYIFGKNIRHYMRLQAIDLLCTFFNNKRLIQNDIHEVYKVKLKHITKLVYEKTTMVVAKNILVQPKLITSLQLIIKTIDQSAVDKKHDWKKLLEMITDLKQQVLKKKELENGKEEQTSDINLEDIFNLCVTPVRNDSKLCTEVEESSDEFSDEKKTEPEGIDKGKAYPKSILKKENSSTVTGQDKTKKRKKKHGRNVADKNISKKLRLEAGAEGLIEGCFSQLQLPSDICDYENFEEENADENKTSEEFSTKRRKKDVTEKNINLHRTKENQSFISRNKSPKKKKL